MPNSPFYVVEYVNGIPHITRYETLKYAQLHARMCSNSQVYSSNELSKRFSNLIDAFMFNPFKPSKL